MRTSILILFCLLLLAPAGAQPPTTERIAELKTKLADKSHYHVVSFFRSRCTKGKFSDAYAVLSPDLRQKISYDMFEIKAKSFPEMPGATVSDEKEVGKNKLKITCMDGQRKKKLYTAWVRKFDSSFLITRFYSKTLKLP